jgi:hypothetical protein
MSISAAMDSGLFVYELRLFCGSELTRNGPRMGLNKRVAPPGLGGLSWE